MTAFSMKSLSATLISSLKHSQLICTSGGQSYLLGQLFGKWQFFSLGTDHRTLSRIPLPIWSYDWVVPAGDKLLMYCLVRRRSILWCPETGEHAPIYGCVPRGSGRVQSSFRDGFVHIWFSPVAIANTQPELLYGIFSTETEELVSPFEQILDHSPNKLLLINDRDLLTWSSKQQQICLVTLNSKHTHNQKTRTQSVTLNASFTMLRNFIGITHSGDPLLLVQAKDETKILKYDPVQDVFSTLFCTACCSVETTMTPDGKILLLLSTESSTELYLLHPKTAECTHTGSTSPLHLHGKPIVTCANQLIVCDWKRQSIISIDLSSL